jgi:uncharacterized repeat protein (TIGR03806 family)
MLRSTFCLLFLTSALSVSSTLYAADQVFDTTTRIPWTTSNVRGTPEPPSSYHTARIYPGFYGDSPLDLQLSPDRKHWFVSLREGQIYTFAVNGDGSDARELIDLRTPAKRDGLNRNIYSLTFHPLFSNNKYMYVCYRDFKPAPGFTYVVRYTLDNDAQGLPSIKKQSEYQLARWPCGQDHFGGSLQFGPDGYLYIPVGDGSGYGDHHETGQYLGDFFASVLRIDVDKAPLGQTYGIPSDNPFLNILGARPEIYAYGLRNIWKMSFDSATGELWGADVGQDLWDSVVKIEKGDNYGWSVKEASYDFRPERKVGPTPIKKPLVEHGHFEARSLTGGFVYRGKLHPELVGAYVYGDFDTGKIWGVRANGNTVTWHQELLDTPLRIVAFAEDADKELVIVHFGGEIHRLIAADKEKIAAANAHPFPRKLSQTGLFYEVKSHLMAPGVLPYSVNSPLWSDHSYKERFMALPPDGKISYQQRYGWDFPDGTVLVKSFSLALVENDPNSRTRLETRIMHKEEDHWRGYTYIWNEAQDDAELLDEPAGLNRTYTIRAQDGSTRQQVWHFPGRAECTLCHTMPMNFVLGPETAQMNRLHDYGNGNIQNQISVLDKLGMLTTPLPANGPDGLAKMANPSDTTATLDKRARAYLHANCSHCHVRLGGGNAYFYLPHHLSLKDTGALDTLPQHGDFGIPNARIIAPGDPHRSLILHRMLSLGPERMPRLASSVIDAEGVALINAWIKSLEK